MSDDLTYDQRYNVPFQAEFNNLEVEYGDCGSHKLDVKGTCDLEDAQKMFDYLKTVPGIIQ